MPHGTPTSTHELEVKLRRAGTMVALMIRCADEYDAMETYDRILQASRTGQVAFELGGVTANAG